MMAKVRCFACLGYRFMGAKFCFVCLGAGTVDHDAMCTLGCGRVAVKTVNNKNICFSTGCFEAANHKEHIMTQQELEDAYSNDGYSWLMRVGHGDIPLL